MLQRESDVERSSHEEEVPMTPAPQHSEPASSRPRMYGGHLEPRLLPWKWAEAQLGVFETQGYHAA